MSEKQTLEKASNAKPAQEKIRIRQWRMTAPDADFQLTEQDSDAIGDGEALVQVAGCGVCHTDISFWHQGVQTKHTLPLTLGHEISGVVVSGSEKWLNKSVIIPAVLPCGECDLCRNGRSNICRQQLMPGNDFHGGFASHIKVPSKFLCEVPENMLAKFPLAHLAVIADAISTPYQVVKKSELQAGDLEPGGRQLAAQDHGVRAPGAPALARAPVGLPLLAGAAPLPSARWRTPDKGRAQAGLDRWWCASLPFAIRVVTCPHRRVQIRPRQRHRPAAVIAPRGQDLVDAGPAGFEFEGARGHVEAPDAEGGLVHFAQGRVAVSLQALDPVPQCVVRGTGTPLLLASRLAVLFMWKPWRIDGRLAWPSGLD